MKTFLMFLVIIYVPIITLAQGTYISNDHKIKLDFYNSEYSNNMLDVRITDNNSQGSYYLGTAFFDADYNEVNIIDGNLFDRNTLYLKMEDLNIIESDLDNDTYNEYILIGLTGGNGTTVFGYIIDLKVSPKPVCIIGLSIQTEEYLILVGEPDRKRIVITDSPRYGGIRRFYLSCYKYSKGRLIFDDNKDGQGYKENAEKQIIDLRNDLEKIRKNYWKTNDNKGLYDMILETYLMQNLVINEDYELEKEIEYYNYHFKSENQDLINYINTSLVRLINDNHKFIEY